MMSQLNSSYAGAGTPPPQQLASGGGITRSAQYAKPPSHSHNVAFELPRQTEYLDRGPSSGSAPPAQYSMHQGGSQSLRGSLDGGTMPGESLAE